MLYTIFHIIPSMTSLLNNEAGCPAKPWGSQFDDDDGGELFTWRRRIVRCRKQTTHLRKLYEGGFFLWYKKLIFLK